MNKPKFFTGPNCSGCKVIKNLLAESGKENAVEVVDVEAQPMELRKYGIRSLPTIMTPNFDYKVGTESCLNFIRSI